LSAPSSFCASGTVSIDWLLPAKSYFGNRFSTLNQITPDNVRTLGLAWKTEISDDGEQEASPIVSNGTMYIATPHDNVLALDVRTGRLKWQFPYNPPVILVAISVGAPQNLGQPQRTTPPLQPRRP
jgi:alcohol dehydrogenase (cytochrome c)